MRRECPNDRRPTRSASAGRLACHGAGGRPASCQTAGIDPAADGTESIGDPTVRTAAQKRRRGSRGGRNRKKPAGPAVAGDGDEQTEKPRIDVADGYDADDAASRTRRAVPRRCAPCVARRRSAGTPKRMSEGPSVGWRPAEQALVRKPQIGDTRPAPPVPPAPPAAKPSSTTRRSQPAGAPEARQAKAERQASRRGRCRPTAGRNRCGQEEAPPRRQGPRSRPTARLALDLDADTIERRRGRERNGRPIGRYLMAVQVRPSLTQVAVLEGRNLIEHYVSRPADDVSQIHGNIYLGKVQNVLPGMEAAFVDIGTPKNAVLYRGDVQYDPEDIVEKSGQMRIEQMLRPKQLVLCQVTKNPISAKGARLTQEVSLPGRFVVLIPNSKTYGISKRLPDDVRKRLRNILDRVKPAQHGLIVRTAAENANEHELRADMTRLLDQWSVIEAKAKKANSPTLLYREPELAVRVDPRGVQRRVPRRRSSTIAACSKTCATTSPRSTPISPTASSTTTRPPRACRCTSASTSTSSCTRRSIARCGCPAVAR